MIFDPWTVIRWCLGTWAAIFAGLALMGSYAYFAYYFFTTSPC